MIIDKNSGLIELPNGLVITTELVKSDFEESTYGKQAQPYDRGTFPFQWYRLTGGILDVHEIGLDLCFYKEELVMFNACVNFYPVDAKDWRGYSLEIESQTKQFHDKLLRNILGSPHEKFPIPEHSYDLRVGDNLAYHYKWGSVWSGYDGFSGNSSIVVRYGSRLEDAQNDYQKNSK
jgi:hypothetical protein